MYLPAVAYQAASLKRQGERMESVPYACGRFGRMTSAGGFAQNVAPFQPHGCKVDGKPPGGPGKELGHATAAHLTGALQASVPGRRNDRDSLLQ